MNLFNIYQTILFEHYISDRETRWMWISPSNDVIFVPKLNHKGFIMSKYRNLHWDYDVVFDQAIKDGWVRGIYEYNERNFKGELSLNTYDKERIISVLNNVFKDFIKYGNKSIYIDVENPQQSKWFSTNSTESKQELYDFLNT